MKFTPNWKPAGFKDKYAALKAGVKAIQELKWSNTRLKIFGEDLMLNPNKDHVFSQKPKKKK